MRTLSLLIVIFIFSNILISQNIEEITFAKKVKISSSILDEERTIFISTPENYNNSNSSYPVLYVLDGDVDKIKYASGLVSDLSTRAMCPNMIVVAIANTKRFRDMTPNNSNIDSQGKKANWGNDYGKADRFLRFIELEVFPYVESNYRTLPYRVVTGHSASAMCITHAFLSHTKMFNSYIAISPTLWWDENLFNRTADKNIQSMNLKYNQFYFSIGSLETPLNIRNGYQFYQTLSKKSPSDFNWKYDFIENETHGSQATLALYNGLRFVFNNWKYDYDKFLKEGMVYINSFFKDKSKKYGYEISPSEPELNSFGYAMIRLKKFEEAINIFKTCTEKSPNSPNAYDSLGDAYYYAGKIDLSINSYKKAIELGSKQNDEQLQAYKNNLKKAEQKKAME